MKRSMDRAGRSAERTSAPPSFIPPYPPSWSDRLKRRLDRLPGPFWIAYLLLWIAAYGIETLLHWSAAAYPPGTLSPVHALLTAFGPGGLLLIHALDRLAERSFDSFRPTVVVGSDPRVLRYQLATMPRNPTTLVTGASILLGVVFLLWNPARGPAASLLANLDLMQLARSPAVLAFNAVVIAATFTSVGLLVYHTLRQLRWVSRIYTHWTHVDLLKPGPLYSLSRLSAGTALSLSGLVYVILAADRALMRDPRNMIGAGVAALLAVLAFVLPLLGVHRVLVAEKERLLDEAADRMKASLAELHDRVDRMELREMDALNKAIASLEVERNLLLRIPTWPWQPETLRTVVGALVLPLLLWVAQAVFGRMLPS